MQSKKLINNQFKDEIKLALKRIQSGDFHRDWEDEAKEGYSELNRLRSELTESPLNDITRTMLDLLKKNNNDS